MTFNETQQLRKIGEAVKQHFTEENEKHDKVTETISGLNNDDWLLWVAATAPERRLPDRPSWLGADYLSALGDEMEATEIWQKGNNQ